MADTPSTTTNATPMTSGQIPRHPPTTYNATYPYNQVWVSEAGHRVHWDNTPGHERYRIVHKAGTYEEISPDGRHVAMCVANRFDYVKGGLTETIDKNHDHKVSGSHRMSVSGDAHTEVTGKSSMMVSGDHATIIGGDSTHAVQGDHVVGVTGKSEMRFGGGLKIKFDGDTSDHTTANLIIDKATDIEIGQTLTINVTSDVVQNTGATHTINAASDIIITSQTKITLTVGASSIEIAPGHIFIDTPMLVESQTTYHGMASKGSTDGAKQIETISGPAKQAFALPG